MQITYLDKILDIEFDPSPIQGFRMTAREWVGNEWQEVPDYTWQTLRLGQTYFEALCNLSSDLWDEAVHAESLAELLDIPMRFSDDVECENCHTWGDEDWFVLGANMLPELLAGEEIGNWDYFCESCYLDKLTKYNN